MRFFLTVVASFLGVLAAFLFIFIFVVGLLAAQDPTPTVPSRSVLVLDIDRSIPEAQPDDPFAELLAPRAVTLREIINALEKAAADDRIVGVWLRGTTPGASWATLAELRQALYTYRQSGKPLVASSGANGFTQTGYFLATVADSIYTPPEAFFVMNGFRISAPFFGGTFERLGIEPIVVRAGDFKAAAENLTERQFSEENREQIARILFSIDDRFRSAVAESRGVDRAALDQVIEEGGFHAARQAYAFGLVDELRYEHDVERLWKTHTRQQPDAELRTVSLREYVRVPARDAGLRPGDRANRIAVLYATGVIQPGRGQADALASETFIETLQEALRDDRTRAIVLRVDSPGGSATASDAMWDAVRDAAERLPVIVSMASVAASGGYYIAAPATAIMAERSTITGSIGVISVLFDATDFLEDRLGITLDAIETGPAAGLFAIGEAPDPLELQIMREFTEGVYTTFINRVAEGRQLPPDSVRALGQGRVYNGEDALRVGLVDELGGLEDAIRLAAARADLEEGDYRLLILPRRRPLLERLTEAFSTEVIMQLWRQRVMSPEELRLVEEARLAREAIKMHGTPQMRMLAIPEIR